MAAIIYIESPRNRTLPPVSELRRRGEGRRVGQRQRDVGSRPADSAVRPADSAVRIVGGDRSGNHGTPAAGRGDRGKQLITGKPGLTGKRTCHPLARIEHVEVDVDVERVYQPPRVVSGVLKSPFASTRFAQALERLAR